MKKTIVQTQKLTPEAILRRVQTHCFAYPAQTAQLSRSLVQPKQPEKQSIAQKLSNSVNRAQLPQSPFPKKQQRKQPKTKTVDIETQWQKPLTQHKNWLSEPQRRKLI
jgi:hypothetical protein